MATYNLGRFILNPRGTYSSSANYNKLDFVLYNGSSYVCKADSTTNKVPTNTTYWQMMAQAGQATMTPEQQQQIIDTLVNGGVIIDPDYNTFTTSEKEKLAGLSVPNNGTLTIKQGGNTLGTFKANQSTNSTVTIANNTLTLKRNNTTVGTYSPSATAELNIAVPVKLTDLNDGATVKVKEAIVTPDTQDGDNEVLTDKGHILKLMPNTKYFTKALTAFEIQDLAFVNDYDSDLIENDKSYVVIHAQSAFDISLPKGNYLNGSVHFKADETGLMTIHGKYIKIEKYDAI